MCEPYSHNSCPDVCMQQKCIDIDMSGNPVVSTLEMHTTNACFNFLSLTICRCVFIYDAYALACFGCHVEQDSIVVFLAYILIYEYMQIATVQFHSGRKFSTIFSLWRWGMLPLRTTMPCGWDFQLDICKKETICSWIESAVRDYYLCCAKHSHANCTECFNLEQWILTATDFDKNVWHILYL